MWELLVVIPFTVNAHGEPNGVRNPSCGVNAERKRDSSARGVPRNDEPFRIVNEIQLRIPDLISAILFLSLYSVDEQRSRLTKRPKLRGVTEPAARIGFRRGRRIGDAAMRYIGEARIAK